MSNGILGRFYKKDNDAASPGDAQGSGGRVTLPVVPAIQDDAGQTAGIDWVGERVNLHRYILDRINLAILDTLDYEEISTQVRPIVREYIQKNNFALNA